jgi:uncharacterized protein YdaU (DUF1376 family)
MSDALPWYQRFPKDVLTGINGLTLEERGAYLTILELIYYHGGAIDDDERFIAGWLRVHTRVWRRLRVRLLELGKLYVNGPHLRNARADRIISEGRERYQHTVQAGKKSAETRNANIHLLKNFRPPR